MGLLQNTKWFINFFGSFTKQLSLIIIFGSLTKLFQDNLNLFSCPPSVRLMRQRRYVPHIWCRKRVWWAARSVGHSFLLLHTGARLVWRGAEYVPSVRRWVGGCYVYAWRLYLYVGIQNCFFLTKCKHYSNRKTEIKLTFLQTHNLWICGYFLSCS